MTKEVVSLDLPPAERAQMIATGPGPHLTPQQFHDVIAAAAAAGTACSTDKDTGTGIEQEDNTNAQARDELHEEEEEEEEEKRKNLVLIDVRNIYETEIGRFSCPPGIPVLDPKTRKVRLLNECMRTAERINSS